VNEPLPVRLAESRRLVVVENPSATMIVIGPCLAVVEVECGFFPLLLLPSSIVRQVLSISGHITVNYQSTSVNSVAA